VGISELRIATLPRLLAVEVLLAEPEALRDDILESCLYLLRDRLRGNAGDDESVPRTAWVHDAEAAILDAGGKAGEGA
jgi:hypothetical protein